LFGPPGIVFFDPAGTPSGKVVGYEPAPAFIDSVRRVWPDTAPREVASR
jgi:thiol:disulfide interchange protein